MQGDNNLVIYDSIGVYFWASWTNNPGFVNCQLKMRDDGNLIIFQSNGSIVWQSNTIIGKIRDLLKFCLVIVKIKFFHLKYLAKLGLLNLIF